MPTLVQGALQARLDRLDPQTRETLSLAAVIGRTFGDAAARADPAATSRSCRRSPSSSGSTSSSSSAAGRSRSTASATGSSRRSPTRASSSRSGASCTSRSARRSRRSTPTRREEVYGAPRPPLHRGGRAREGGRLPPPGGRRGSCALRRPAGDRALQPGARVPRPPRRRSPGSGHALQDRARAPPRVRLRGSGGGLRRGVLLPRRRAAAARARRSGIETVIDERPDDFVPGDVYSTEALQLTAHLFRGLLAVDGELTSSPPWPTTSAYRATARPTSSACARACAGATASRSTADDFVFAWQRMREEERSDRVPARGHLRRRRARRPHARGARLTSRAATSRTSSPRGRSHGRGTSARSSATTGASPRTSSPTGRSSSPSSTTSTRS